MATLTKSFSRRRVVAYAAIPAFLLALLAIAVTHLPA